MSKTTDNVNKASNNRCVIQACLLSLAVIAAFFLPVFHAWLGYPLFKGADQESYSALLGILPWSDAPAYYSGAGHLLQEGDLNDWNTRRPLNAILFAIRLWLSGGNFNTALLLQAALCAVASLGAASALAKTWGKKSGLLVGFCLWFYASTYLPTTLSETLGLTLGALAFTCLWQGLKLSRLWVMLMGCFFYTVALNARSGTFFVVPLLIIWLGFAFKKEGQRYNWSASLLALITVLLAFLLNHSLALLYGDVANGGLQANFAHTLFGLVAGGKGWAYAHEVYANFTGSEPEFARHLYQQSLELFLNKPWLLGLGLLKSGLGACKGMLNILLPTSVENIVLKSSLRVLGGLVLLALFWKAKTLYRYYPKQLQFLLIALVGIAASSCVIWKDGGVRVFAASFPFIAAFSGLLLVKPREHLEASSSSMFESYASIIVAGLLYLAAFIMPPFMTETQKEGLPTLACTLGTEPLRIKAPSLAPHKIIKRKPDLSIAEKFSTLSQQDYQALLTLGAIEKVPSEAFQMLIPMTEVQPLGIGLIYSSTRKSTVYIVGPEIIFKQNKPLEVCGHFLPSKQPLLFYVDSFKSVENL